VHENVSPPQDQEMLFVPGSVATGTDCVPRRRVGLRERVGSGGACVSGADAGRDHRRLAGMVTLLKKLVGTLPECQPIEFTSANQALAWCASHDRDLVIIDYLMPERHES
jgi:CheY-like chemotaxis protein